LVHLLGELHQQVHDVHAPKHRYADSVPLGAW
jgi:hypothetical protein